MLILSEFNIEFILPAPAAIIALLHLHPSLQPRLRSSDELLVESLGVPFPPNTVVPTVDYIDGFGNICSRFSAAAGHLRLSGSNIIEAEEFPDSLFPDAQQMPVNDLPSDVLQFLLPSRYCEVDQFGAIAHNEFGSTKPGWERAVAIRDWYMTRSRLTTAPRGLRKLQPTFLSNASGSAVISSTWLLLSPVA